jgi:hypothetical protein
MTKFYYLFLLLISSLWFGGCNLNSLKVEDAKSQLIKYYKNNPKEAIGSFAFEAVIIGKDSGNNKMFFRLYNNAGLMKIKEVKFKNNSDSIYIFEVTEIGKPFLINEIISKQGYPVFVIKTFEYYVADVTQIKYSPDKKEAAAKFDLAIHNLTPFGKIAADLNHKNHLIGFFKFENNKWKFERIEIDIDKL